MSQKPCYSRAVLPRIRRRVAADLPRKDLSREKVIVTIIRLLETTLIRVINDEYAQQNGSYGMTTPHNRHARVHGMQITFSFKGKSGTRHQINVKDPRLAKLVLRCQELPGQQLFEYLDEAGAVHGVISDDVDAYLRDVELVAERFGNTATVCRRCYIHPAILDGFISGQAIAVPAERRLHNASARLRPEETAVMALLKRRRSGEGQNGA